MPKSFEQSLDEIARLANFYRVNRTTLRASTTLEADARQSLIDPFFVALDWDVHNTDGAALRYRPVIFEESREIEGTRKAPDYTFRIGGERKFFAEAKKPRVSIENDRDPAYQLRRYGWSASLPLSLLTDFEELAVYDCRIMPKLADTARTARLKFYTYEQYPDRWREIWDIFSFPAVRGGSFDQYVETNLTKRGVIPVDVQILQDIEGWRKLLASNLALRNRALSTDDLNDAVQKTLDRILFLRIAEDRGIEPYEQLLKATRREHIYAELVRRFRLADTKYNSGLFDFSRTGDTITPKLTIDDATLKEIITQLYLPLSAYAFQVVPAEILGNVYEQFLGKVIHLTPTHQARIEDKPEVRKAGGVYYTPAYIVAYIVKQTVGKAVENKTPKDLEQFRVLDMACGSGSFLLGAYQFLLDWYLKWYVENLTSTSSPKKRGEQKVVQGENGEWRLTTAERKRILTTHIFGVDIDRQAVEVTKLSLLLKVLEGESEESLQPTLAGLGERALPNLDANIKCGNSLIAPDYFSGQLFPDAQELKLVNPFDWEREFPDVMQDGWFDCVIGNPPYIRMEAFKEVKDYLKREYFSHAERTDLYAYFIERANKRLKPNGYFGMIVSNKFLRANYGKPLREFLYENTHIEQIVDFAGLPVFVGATVRTIILLAKHVVSNQLTMYSPPLSIDKFNAVKNGSLSIEEAITHSSYAIIERQLSEPVWSLVNERTDSLLARLKQRSILLKDYIHGPIGYGIKSGLEEAFILTHEDKIRLLGQNPNLKRHVKPYLNGKDVRRYHIDYNKSYIIYTYHGVDVSNASEIVEHLRPFKSRLQKRATRQEWYELQQPQFNYVQYFDHNKIVYPDIATSPRFALDSVGYYGSTTTFFIPQPDLYLLALLNSSLARLYFVVTCAGLEGKKEVYLRFKRQYVESFPVHPINFSDATDKARHDKMVALVEQMLALHKHLAGASSDVERAVLQRQIEATDAQIDALVYELYDLTPEEIKIIEGKYRVS